MDSLLAVATAFDPGGTCYLQNSNQLNKAHGAKKQQKKSQLGFKF